MNGQAAPDEARAAVVLALRTQGYFWHWHEGHWQLPAGHPHEPSHGQASAAVVLSLRFLG